jgi:preprotein translocase subunit YajC
MKFKVGDTITYRTDSGLLAQIIEIKSNFYKIRLVRGYTASILGQTTIRTKQDIESNFRITTKLEQAMK